MARGISGVAPTIYLRAKAVVPATAAVADSRPKVYALQRFAKTQLAHADAAEKVCYPDRCCASEKQCNMGGIL